MAKSSFLTGADRVEFSQVLGRKIRSGALAELNVSDQERAVQWIREGRTEDALNLLEVLRPLYLDMSTILFEWSLAFAEILRERVGKTQETQVTETVYKQWGDVIRSENESPEQTEAGAVLLKIFDPQVPKTSADRIPLSEKINAEPLAAWKETNRLIQAEKSDEAVAMFERFIRQSRGRHDFLCQYLWVYPTAISETCGQTMSEEVMLESFQTCTFYEPFFEKIEKLSPEAAVAVLAEHLRGHFSGPGRKGKVEIIEESDRYRMVFDACGSGGAMRRKAVEKPMPGLENYPQASNAVWGMAGNVSTYCAHCAQNEMVMIDRFGFPAWVVNFDPDPMKPCGWTVYKDATQIPEEYYTRIGRKKDLGKIKKPPQD